MSGQDKDEEKIPLDEALDDVPLDRLVPPGDKKPSNIEDWINEPSGNSRKGRWSDTSYL